MIFNIPFMGVIADKSGGKRKSTVNNLQRDTSLELDVACSSLRNGRSPRLGRPEHPVRLHTSDNKTMEVVAPDKRFDPPPFLWPPPPVCFKVHQFALHGYHFLLPESW
ncbi:hypothetical protein TcWFU_000101 [Taenia crassiceps]|uniref:Uncharacterized protein n=1 Tax=Taenia crassiceps TaxID=6207 RepID=A0ABR4Q296_9CEST